MTTINDLDDFKALELFFPYANRYISVLTITDRKVTRWRDYLDPVAIFDAGSSMFWNVSTSAS